MKADFSIVARESTGETDVADVVGVVDSSARAGVAAAIGT